MKTSSYRHTKPRTPGILANAFSCLVVGLLLLMVLPSVAFASPAAGYTFGHSQALDLASVSVVRLVFTYRPTSPAANANCSPASSLGAIVDSSGSTTWVLTDGSLLVTSCKTQTSASFDLQIYPNVAYTTAMPALPLDTTTCQTPQTGTPTCQGLNQSSIVCESLTCTSGAMLISFTTHKPQPFMLPLSAATSQGTSGTSASQRTTGIGLTSSFAFSATSQPFAAPPPQMTFAQAMTFLTPTAVQVGSGGEPGMPIIDTQGNLIGMQIRSGGNTTKANITSITTFVTTNLLNLSTVSNTVHTSWNAAVNDFYARKYTNAAQELRAAQQANPAFLVPAFQTALASHLGAPTTRGTPTPVATPQPGLLGLPISSELAFIGIVGLIILVLILLVLSLFIWRRRAAIHREQEEMLKRVEERANRDAERIRKEEQEQVQAQHGMDGRPPQIAAVNAQPQSAPVPAPAAPPFQQSPVLLSCPNCNAPVKPGDNFCAQCRAVLNPSESGLHLRMVQPPPQQSPELPLDIANAKTVDMSQSQMQQGMDQWQGNPDLERTQPRPPVQPAPQHGRFIVATRSNRGLKRKYKPNEDSLYAVVGNLSPRSSFHDLGMFVVADGMGGHANGRDASNLAIQTIRERVLPELQGEKPMPEEEYMTLLKDGVQSANMAVHQRNVEQHADMGTTMTAALVVDKVAYVANVGDSRTYLYRPSEGLSKITNDHSVVASLVTAGIINAEDVYTHPKRNQIYRSLGEKPDVEVDIFPVQLKPGDVLLLCCDGLWEMTRDRAIEEILRSSSDLAQAGDALIQAAISGGGDDNITVVLVKVDEPQAPAAPSTGLEVLATPDAPQYPPNGIPD